MLLNNCFLLLNNLAGQLAETVEVLGIHTLQHVFIARPCALGLKIQANGPQKAQHNAILEKHPDEKRLEGLSKQLDWDVRTIQRWFRQRRNQEKPSTLSKFCESMKVVRRVSVNERSNLYRREHEKEAIVWQERGRQPEPQDDDEDRQTDAELRQHSSSSGPDPQDEPAQRESNGGKREPSVGNGSTSSALPMEPRGSRLDRSASYQLATEEPAEGDLSREKSHHTLADLKRQRAAAKLYKQPSTTGDNSQDLPPLESPRASTEPSTVHNTPSSTEPPLLKLRAPEEEHPPEKQRCCYLM
ncbi:UNVERIFIED_CONTAM: hypothetical protein FKN15_066650 [Acipenser sinensis]